MKTYGIIMAGGGGTRFWPLSRQETPKQLLNLSGKDLMVNEAIERLCQVADKDDIFIVTNSIQTPKMIEATKAKIKKNHILSEPSSRNTAACIGYAAFEILKKYGDGLMVITPSDAYIKDEKEFAKVLKIALETAKAKDVLVTVGIKPTFASTGYGYIKFKKDESLAFKVLEFKEKPELATAQKYVESGDYLWNSGMFIWKASTILEAFKNFLPNVYSDLEKIAQSMGSQEEFNVIEEIYPKIESISVDYGIMEKSDSVYVVPGDFGWSDVGSFDMLGALHEKDKNQNIIIGDSINIDTKNSIVYSDKRLVATIDLDDVVVVETPDAVLVCKKDRVQDVKKVVEELKAQRRFELL
ncbi:mannose-1-phosphate guanylyltransferase [Treponema pectinovorum]|uniref:mannose-1-phosphate guanylyltransferase n=1 Tax=Treponema pectinovorum TaxID=164 RepID=UPI0011C79B28|nr:mannose-1-phosphate guanylyltransferase [Treponema pectinovorum]